MKNYGITFKDDGGTIEMKAERFAIVDGFLVLYRGLFGGERVHAAYSSDNVLHCVEQKENPDNEH